ncbi:MAG: hypothetical protein CMP18_00710, partial [Rickettsiales bacterium]|jgi:hypothetical protein|nr:hypothetical protein [Rickettsiales bacterium]
MEEGDLNKLSATANEAALKAKSAEEKAKQLIKEGRERMAKQDGQEGGENKGPDPLQSSSEQFSLWQGLVAAISNTNIHLYIYYYRF